MAVEVESTSQLEEFLGVLRRRLWWIVIPTAVCGVLGVSFAVIVPKKYVSTAKILVRDVGSMSSQSVRGTPSVREGSVAPHVIGSGENIQKNLNALPWSDYNMLSPRDQQEYRQRISENLKIHLQDVPNNAGAQIVSLSYANTDPQRAYMFLSGLVTIWKQEVENRYQRNEQETAARLKRDADLLEQDRTAKMKEMEARLIANGLPPRDWARGERGNAESGWDFKWRQFEAAKVEVAADAAEIEDLEGKIGVKRAAHDRAEVEVPESQELESTDEIQLEIATLVKERERLRIGIEGLLSTHPDYKLAQRRFAAIDDSLARLRGSRPDGSGTGERMIPNPERARLVEEISALEEELALAKESHARGTATVERLRLETEELSKEIKQIELLEVQLSEIGVKLAALGKQRIDQGARVASTEGGAGDFFEDLELPTQPSRHTTPNPYVISALGIIGGIALGLALALLSEFSRNTFRSARDMTRVMVVPVLGTVNKIVTKKQRARGIVYRAVLGTGTLAFVLVMGYMTWAWAYDPDSLAPTLRRVIDGVRQPFL